MSDDGGDTGGGFGSDSGGGGKGGGNDSGGFTPSNNSNSFTSTTSPGEQAGFQGSGELPPEISTGNSGGAGPGGFDLGQWGAPSIGDFVSGDTGGFNLAGSGPVGGDSGPIGVTGGVFSSNDSAVPLSNDTNPLGTTSGSAAGGTSALGFAAPAGVAGSTDLSSLVADPNAAGGGGVDTTGAPADPGIFDSLNGAQSQVANDYGTAHAGSVPAEGTTLPAATDVSSASKGGGSGSSGGNSSGFGLNTNTLGVAAAGAGLLNNLVNGNKPLANASALTGTAATNNGTAAQQTAAGTALQQYITTGTLPQGYEDQIQQSAQAAKSQIISNYANRGLPTDPTKNSALAQELAQVDARLPAAREQLASGLATQGTSMINSGLQATGISSSIYTTLANLENDQNKQRGAAIANFASALNGGSKGGVNINLGGTKAA